MGFNRRAVQKRTAHGDAITRSPYRLPHLPLPLVALVFPQWLLDLLLFLPLAVLTNTAFPVPFDYVLIFFAEDYGPRQGLLFAALGSVCASVAGFVDIKMMGAVGSWAGQGTRWQAWRLDRWWFYTTVFLCAFLPVPYLVVRLMLVKGTPRPLAYAVTVGSARFPRYVLLLYYWQRLALPSWASAALLASTLPLIVWRLRGKLEIPTSGSPLARGESKFDKKSSSDHESTNVDKR